MSQRRIALRADGGGDIGLGHVMRCAALARALVRTGAEIDWFTTTPTVLPVWLDDLAHIHVLDDEIETDLLAPMLVAAGSDLLVGDWKSTPADLVAQIRQTVCPVALIGGFTGDAVADLHIRQGFAETSDAPQRSSLSGASWLLLDDAYAGLPPRQTGTRITRLLISLGGTDTALIDRIEAAARQTGALAGAEIQVRRPGGTRDGRSLQPLRDALLEADLAILAGGTTLHEAAATGLPAISVPIVPHQYDRAGQYQRLGLGLMIDPEKPCFERRITETLDALAADPARRGRMARRGQALVDGRGAERLARHLIEFSLSQQARSQ